MQGSRSRARERHQEPLFRKRNQVQVEPVEHICMSDVVKGAERNIRPKEGGGVYSQSVLLKRTDLVAGALPQRVRLQRKKPTS